MSTKGKEDEGGEGAVNFASRSIKSLTKLKPDSLSSSEIAIWGGSGC